MWHGRAEPQEAPGLGSACSAPSIQAQLRYGTGGTCARLPPSLVEAKSGKNLPPPELLSDFSGTCGRQSIEVRPVSPAPRGRQPIQLLPDIPAQDTEGNMESELNPGDGRCNCNEVSGAHLRKWRKPARPAKIPERAEHYAPSGSGTTPPRNDLRRRGPNTCQTRVPCMASRCLTSVAQFRKTPRKLKRISLGCPV